MDIIENIVKLNEYIKNILSNHAHLFIYHGNNYEIFGENILKMLKENYKGKIDNFIQIKPEGKQIKKEQIIELKTKLKFTNTNNKINFYLIFSAEKMNKHTYNALLKFLEEPLNNSVAILITNSINLIAPTIKSRCVFFNYNDMEDVEANASLEFAELHNFMLNAKYQKYYNLLNYNIKDKGTIFLEKYIYYLINNNKYNNKIELINLLKISDSNVNANLIIDHLYLLYNEEVKM